ncbi:MAG: putative immunity protein [Acidimicrobiales bacterium]
MSRSPQTLSEADRRLVAAWAADCAERVRGLFEAEAPDDDRPRALIARTRAFARGELDIAEEIRRRFAGGVGASDVKAPAAAAAARAAGQGVAVCHMGAHALGAAGYAAEAAGLADPDRPEAVGDEIRWQLEHMSPDVRAALRALPPVGENSSGPLGPGLLASGQLGTIIRTLQAVLARPAWTETRPDPAHPESDGPRPTTIRALAPTHGASVPGDGG